MRDLLHLKQTEKRLLKVCADIESRGVFINRDYARNALIYEKAKEEEARKDFEKNTGRAFINSSKLFAEIFTQAGETFPLTALGNPSFKAEFLEDIDTPTARLINKVRHHEKRATTYFKNFLYYSEHDGRLHPSMNQAGTITGRFSYSNPNLQNVPKEDDPNDWDCPSNVRKTFVPPEDFTLLSIDYSQQEYRIMLDYADEKSLIRAVRAGADVHQATADILGISRKMAKTVNFGLLYGIGVMKLAKDLDVRPLRARDIKDLYFKKLPNVRKFLYAVKKKAETRGYVYNMFGRRGYCSDMKFSYKFPNFLCQSTGADVIKEAMVEIHELLKPFKTRMVIQVHDELLFYLHKDEHALVPEIKKIMESIYKPLNGLPLTVSAKHSKLSWSHFDMRDEL